MKRLLTFLILLSNLTILYSQDDLNKYNSERIEFVKISLKDYDNNSSENTDIIKDNSVVKKDGKFELRLSNKTITLRDTIKYPIGTITYSYIGRYDCINQFVVERLIYEGKEYYLIDRRTGKYTYIWNLPKVSPDCRYICSLNLIWGIDGYPGGILIFKIDNSNSSFIEYFKIEYDNWISIDGYWKTKNEFYFKIVSPDYLSYSNNLRVEKNNADKVRYWKILIKE